MRSKPKFSPVRRTYFRQRGILLQQILDRGDRQECYYCKRPFDRSGRYIRTIEHLVPLSKGGTNDLSNLVLACLDCNNRRNISHA